MKIVILSAVLAICACRSEVPLGDRYELVLDVPPEPFAAVDILFVVDDSGSMAPYQTALTDWAGGELFGALEAALGRAPDLHVGVVSTNLGTPGYNISGCGDPSREAGLLQHAPRLPGCVGPAERFLSDVAGPDGERIRNYEGTLGDAVACIATLGNQGCGFEQPFEAMRRALDGSRPENAGFVRDDALLVVVIVTDEDDCSASDPELFDPDQRGLDDPLGPLASYRCFEHGVVCDGDAPREAGERTGCRPREDSAYVHPVARYVDFLRGLKADPTHVMVLGLTAGTEQIEMQLDGAGRPELSAACPDLPEPDPRCSGDSDPGQPDAGPSDAGSGSPEPAGPDAQAPPVCHGVTLTPAVRVAALVDAFPGRSAAVSLCPTAMAASLARAASGVADVVGARACLPGRLHDRDRERAGIQPVCRASSVLAPGTAAEQRRELAACAAGAAGPCFELAPDPARCAHTAMGLAAELRAPAQPGAHLRVECVTAD